MSKKLSTIRIILFLLSVLFAPSLSAGVFVDFGDEVLQPHQIQTACQIIHEDRFEPIDDIQRKFHTQGFENAKVHFIPDTLYQLLQLHATQSNDEKRDVTYSLTKHDLWYHINREIGTTLFNELGVLRQNPIDINALLPQVLTAEFMTLQNRANSIKYGTVEDAKETHINHNFPKAFPYFSRIIQLESDCHARRELCFIRYTAGIPRWPGLFDSPILLEDSLRKSILAHKGLSRSSSGVGCSYAFRILDALCADSYLPGKNFKETRRIEAADPGACTFAYFMHHLQRVENCSNDAEAHADDLSALAEGCLYALSLSREALEEMKDEWYLPSPHVYPVYKGTGAGGENFHPHWVGNPMTRERNFPDSQGKRQGRLDSIKCPFDSPYRREKTRGFFEMIYKHAQVVYTGNKLFPAPASEEERQAPHQKYKEIIDLFPPFTPDERAELAKTKEEIAGVLAALEARAAGADEGGSSAAAGSPSSTP